MRKNVGIDAISLYIPKLFISFNGEWAMKRFASLGHKNPDELRNKINFGIGMQAMSLPDYHEDVATMGAMAAVVATSSWR